MAIQKLKNPHLVRYVRGDVHGWDDHNGYFKQSPRSRQDSHDNISNNSNQQYDTDELQHNDNNNDNNFNDSTDQAL